MIHHLAENGTEYLVIAHHATHSCCLQAWVGVGSMHEQAHQRGMAHFVEHMLFKGTKKLGPGQFANLIEKAGGSVNAYTTFDRTVYYLNILSDHVADGAEWLLDCVFDSTFDALEFDREKEVILEEIRRGLDDPNQKLGQNIFSKTYQGTEVARPIIGFEEEVRGFSRDGLHAFHETWYKPNNVKIIAVGDFDEQTMFETLLEKVNHRPAAKIPSHVIETQAAQRRFPEQANLFLLKADYKQPKLEISFAAPSFDHYESVPLDLGIYCLGSGDASRLHQIVHLEKSLVAAIGMSYYAPAFGGLISVNAAVPLETYMPAMREILQVLHDAVTSEPITELELERAKANFMAEKFYRTETLEGICQEYGFSLLTQQKTSYPEVYDALVSAATIESVNAALRRWINPERLVFGGLIPQDSQAFDETTLHGQYQEFLQAAQRSKLEVEKTEKKKVHVSNKKDDSGFFVDGESLPFRFIHRQLPNMRTFNLALISHGGQRYENRENQGVFNAIASMLCVATESYDQRAMAEYMDLKAAEFEGFSGKDSLGLTLSCLADKTSELLPWLRDIWQNPVFPNDYWQNLKIQLFETLKAHEDSPSRQCLKFFREGLYPQNPYGLNLLGSEETIANFDADRLREHYRNHVTNQNWLLTSVGPSSGEEMRSQLAKIFSAQNGKVTKAHKETLPKFAEIKEKHHFLKMDREQTHICIGFPGLTWDDPDRPALDVLTNVLGGQGGRLFLRLRDRDSLAYSISPLVSYGLLPGFFGSYIACASNKVDEAYAKMIDEMMLMTTEQLDAEELQRGIQFIVGNHELDMQRGSAQAMSMAVMELYGVGYRDFLDYMKAIKVVSSSDVLRVAQRVFNPKQMVSSVVGRLDRKG